MDLMNDDFAIEVLTAADDEVVGAFGRLIPLLSGSAPVPDRGRSPQGRTGGDVSQQAVPAARSKKDVKRYPKDDGNRISEHRRESDYPRRFRQFSEGKASCSDSKRCCEDHC